MGVKAGTSKKKGLLKGDNVVEKDKEDGLLEPRPEYDNARIGDDIIKMCR